MAYVSNMKKALFGSLLVAAVAVITTGCTASTSSGGAKCGGEKTSKCGAGKCGTEKNVDKCGGN